MQSIIKTGFINVDNVDNTIKKLSLLREKGIFVQLVNVTCLASEKQLEIAFLQATEAMKNKTNLSNLLELEFLIRLTGKRQIEEALKIAGIQEGKHSVALFLSAENKNQITKNFNYLKKELDFKYGKNLIEKNYSKNQKNLMKIYGIGENELNTLNDLGKDALHAAILEKISLVALER